MPPPTGRPLPDYPFASHHLNLHGHNLHYLDEGPTPPTNNGQRATGNGSPSPILMLHGNPTWSFYYRRLISALAPTHRCIVPDHIGMGLSDKPPESQYQYTLESRVSDLEKLIDTLLPPMNNEPSPINNRLTLILHDWGGMIGMAFATRHPERIGKIVILNTGGFTLPKSKKMPWQLSLARSPILGALLVRGLNAFSRGATKDCVTRPLSKAVADAYCAPYNSWHNRLAVHRFIQDIPLHPTDRAYNIVAHVERNLSQFQNLPIFICWGMKDFVFDIHFLNRWLELFPKAQVHRFEDAGHYILEDAHEQIIPLIQSFLATPTTQPPTTSSGPDGPP